jgi:hypothetical protein
VSPYQNCISKRRVRGEKEKQEKREATNAPTATPQQSGYPRTPAALLRTHPESEHLRRVAPPADVVESHARVGISDGPTLHVRKVVLLWRAREAAGGERREVAQEIEGRDVLERRLIRSAVHIEGAGGVLKEERLSVHLLLGKGEERRTGRGRCGSRGRRP